MFRKYIPALITIIVIVVASTTLSARKTRLENQENAGKLVVECIQNLMVIAKYHGKLLEQYESRHQAIKHSLVLFAEEKTDERNPLSPIALQLCRDVGKIFIDSELQALEVIETAQSERMSDPGTVKIASEYEWRIETIDRFRELIEKAENFDASRIDEIRQAMVATSLPKESKVIIFSHLKSIPTERSRAQIRANYTIRQYLEAEKKLLEFLYQHADDYSIGKDGTPEFKSADLLQDFNKLSYAAIESRRKSRGLGGDHFFGRKPVISAPITTPGSLG